MAWALPWAGPVAGGRLVGGVSPHLAAGFPAEQTLCFETDVKSRAAGGGGGRGWVGGDPAPDPQGRSNREAGCFTAQTGGWSYILQGTGRGPVAHPSVQDTREGFRGGPGPTLSRRRTLRACRGWRGWSPGPAGPEGRGKPLPPQRGHGGPGAGPTRRPWRPLPERPPVHTGFCLLLWAPRSLHPSGAAWGDGAPANAHSGL